MLCGVQQSSTLGARRSAHNASPDVWKLFWQCAERVLIKRHSMFGSMHCVLVGYAQKQEQSFFFGFSVTQVGSARQKKRLFCVWESAESAEEDEKKNKGKTKNKQNDNAFGDCGRVSRFVSTTTTILTTLTTPITDRDAFLKKEKKKQEAARSS